MVCLFGLRCKRNVEAYLDNAATTVAFDEVTDLMVKVMREDYGNPSSLHKKGLTAEHYIRDAKERIARQLRVEPKEIYFTSGGTESNNTALIGAAMANRRQGKHIITSSIEHASVLNPLAYLKEQGFRITYLPVDEHGIIKLDALQQAICEDTILISIMGVNNEVGAVQPLEEVAAIIRECGRTIVFHVDGIQMFGKLPIYPKRMGIDLLSVSGHKIHGPKGSGILYVKEKTKIRPLILGGNQQSGFRSGTENVPAIAGMGLASQLIEERHEERFGRMGELKQYFIKEVTKLPDCIDHSGKAPHIISITFRGVRSEVLLHALEEKCVYVSSGSACSSNKPELSGTLLNMGLSRSDAESTLRFSLSVFTTKEEIDYALQCIAEELPVLRRFTRR